VATVGAAALAGVAAGGPPPWLSGGAAGRGGLPDGIPTGPPGGGELRLRLYVVGDPAAVLGPVAQTLAARQARLVGVQVGEASLEDVFINLTGRGLR